MPVDSTHPEYELNVDRWCLVRDVVRSHVKHHIPDIDPNDTDRNKRYKDGAQFTNFTARTRNSLVGQVFRKPMVVTLPP